MRPGVDSRGPGEGGHPAPPGTPPRPPGRVGAEGRGPRACGPSGCRGRCARPRAGPRAQLLFKGPAGHVARTQLAAARRELRGWAAQLRLRRRAAQRRAGPDRPGLRRTAERRTRAAMAEAAPAPVSAPARTPSPARPPTPPPRGPARVSAGRPERPARRLRPGPRFGPARAAWPPSSGLGFEAERPGGPNARPGAAGGRPRRRGTGRAF